MEIVRTHYTLRPWRMSDATSLAKHANNIRVWNNIRDQFPHPYSEKDGEAFIGMVLKKPKPEEFAIVVDGHAAGGVGLVPMSDVERFSAEIGYWLGEAYWGRGIVSEAVKDVVAYAWSHTAFNRLFAGIFAYNKASQRVLEKAGFRKVGILEKAAFKNGAFVDMVYYELVKKE